MPILTAVDPTATAAADGRGGWAPSDASAGGRDVGPRRLEILANVDMNDARVCCREEDPGGARDIEFANGSDDSPKAMHRISPTMISQTSEKYIIL